MPGSDTTNGIQPDGNALRPISAARPMLPMCGAESNVEQTL